MYKNVLNVYTIFNEAHGEKYHFGEKYSLENCIKIYLEI
jgi:hypothetical protein